MLNMIRLFLSELINLGLYDRDYMREPKERETTEYRKPPTIVIVGGILALLAFGLLVLAR